MEQVPHQYLGYKISYERETDINTETKTNICQRRRGTQGESCQRNR